MLELCLLTLHSNFVPFYLTKCSYVYIHTVVKFKIHLQDKVFTSPLFQGMPLYRELRDVLAIQEDVRIYCKYADSQSYFLLSEHLMPEISKDFVLRLSKTSPPASPEGIHALLHALFFHNACI